VGADCHYLTGESLAEQAKEEASRHVKPMSNPVEAYYHTRDSGDLLDSEKETERKMSIVREPVGMKLRENEDFDTFSYDTMILGSGPAML
jgi:hypothetical protein